MIPAHDLCALDQRSHAAHNGALATGPAVAYRCEKDLEEAMIRRIAFGLALIVLASLAMPASAQRLVKREPPMGALKNGQRVLVDDGSCGPGRVLEVIGGDHVKAGGTKNIERRRRCISRR